MCSISDHKRRLKDPTGLKLHTHYRGPPFQPIVSMDKLWRQVYGVLLAHGDIRDSAGDH